MRSQRHVLAVDDNPRNLFIMEKLLGDEHAVHTAASGEEALERVAELRPDLILLDIMMPGIDGYETCRRIRAEERFGRPKIIMVSAKAMVQERLEGYAAGADDYITKPFNGDELVAKVKVYLELKSVQEVEKLRGDLITLLRHETHTPISVILSGVDLLQASEHLSENDHELIEMMSRSTHRLLRLVERTVTFSQIRGAEDEHAPASTDLNMVVRASMRKLQSEADAKSIRLVESFEGEPSVHIDRRFGDYVICALIENAITASVENSDVCVSTSADEGGVQIQVTDHGKGLDASIGSSMFDPFVVGDLSHHGDGLGMGLAIARELTELHGGTIQVESDGDATRFTVRLPAGTAAGASPGTLGDSDDTGLARAA